jgi:hypothetical protein
MLPYRVSRLEIVNIKALAVRRGVWYRVLTRTERACVDLTIRVVDEVRSRVLSDVLLSVFRKLEMAVESKVARLMRDVGVKVAGRLGLVAQSWGNESAACWAEDVGFVRFLAVLHLNSSS